MITIEITKNKDINKIEVKGHADFDLKGKDIVCAGVSAVTYAGLNSLTKISLYEVSVKEGLTIIDFCNQISEHDKIVAEVMINGYKSIAEEFSKNVKIIERKE